MLLRICHTTRFDYEMPAYDSHNEVRMKPLEGARQRCVRFELEIGPDAAVFEYDDYYGNRVHGFSIHERHPTLIVTAKSLVERIPGPQPPALAMPFGEFLLEDHVRNRIEYDFLSASRHVPFSDPMRKFFWLAKPDTSEDVAVYANRVVAFIRDQFVYEPGMTKVQSTADEILTVGGGVCQDFAHLTIGVLRLAGIPSRYVSGYLAPAAKATVETVGAQASHAWLEAQLPGQGWTGFDPTNGCTVDERHIRVAVGRDYSDVPPMRGVYRSQGGKQLMSVELQIEPQPEHPIVPTNNQQNQQ
ncbi:MAG TPA: transglutaminase family protein [Candidatus Acidoferrum sp.]|nr:transglutaminase family protein [Candidatus Acidoferrum sp.]